MTQYEIYIFTPADPAACAGADLGNPLRSDAHRRCILSLPPECAVDLPSGNRHDPLEREGEIRPHVAADSAGCQFGDHRLPGGYLDYGGLSGCRCADGADLLLFPWK